MYYKRTNYLILVKLEEQKLNIQSLMFNYKQLEFEPIKIDNSSIGVLKYKPLSVLIILNFFMSDLLHVRELLCILRHAPGHPLGQLLLFALLLSLLKGVLEKFKISPACLCFLLNF